MDMTDRHTKRFNVIENLGWPDRAIRIMVGTALVAVPLTIITINAPRLDEGASISGWLYVVMLLALYPFWTTAIGWDPFYNLFKVRSCGGTEKNPCGTLPYELDAAVGRHPIPESDVMHSLGTAHHPGQKNRMRQQDRGAASARDEPRRAAAL
jgi:Inner membrane protein YgaP-like, transmembrane domain